jgi:hypothetical protein
MSGSRNEKNGHPEQAAGLLATGPPRPRPSRFGPSHFGPVFYVRRNKNNESSLDRKMFYGRHNAHCAYRPGSKFYCCFTLIRCYNKNKP